MMKELGRELSASKSLVEAISLPGRLPILQRKDFKEMHEVFEYLMLKNISKNVDYIKGYNSLLMRRLIIAAAKNGQWQEIAKFTGLFGRPALVKEICKMGVEFSRYYRVARR
jgi:hypothetical protein